MSISDITAFRAHLHAKRLREVASALHGASTPRARATIEPRQLTDIAAALEKEPIEARVLVDPLVEQIAADENRKLFTDPAIAEELHWRLRDVQAFPNATASLVTSPVTSVHLRTMRGIRTAIDKSTRTFVRTTPFAVIDHASSRVTFDVRDLLLVAAIAHVDVLMVGRTGTGKTKLATGILGAIFGSDGIYSKTTLPSMSPADFMDIDFAGIKAGSKSSRDAISGVAALTKPGIILNEANRAPAVVQAMLIPFLDREFEIEGKPVPVGIEHRGERYQFRVLTINEGDEYDVEPFDPALRDRAVFQIPIDAFPQTEADVFGMLEQLTEASPPTSGETPSHLSEVLELHDLVRQIPLAPAVPPFLVYLSGLSNCIRSITGYKEAIALHPVEHCAGCRHSLTWQSQNLCGHVRAPSPRAVVNLVRVAQAFALTRCVKIQSGVVDDNQEVPAIDCTVTLDDLIAAAPFVLRGKLGLDPRWLQTATPLDGAAAFKGCEWEAVRHILVYVRQQFEKLLGSGAYHLVERAHKADALSLQELAFLEKYARETDNWCCNAVRLARQMSQLDPHQTE